MRLILSFVFLFLGGVIYWIPTVSRRGVLFAVPIPEDFDHSPLGRHSIAAFHSLVFGSTLIGVCSVLFSPTRFLEAVSVGGPILILIAGGFGFAWQNRRLVPFAVQPSLTREVDLSSTPERVPWFTWLAAGPFAMLAMAAAFLRSNWDRIPAHFPVHWGADGSPNRWSDRSVHGVYGPLLFAAELCAWVLIMSLAMWFGARRSRLRRIVVGVMNAVEYILGLIFGAIAIEPVLHIPIWIPVLLPLVFFVPLLLVMAREVHHAAGPLEPTPNDRWKAVLIYYNPDDAALMVEKRTGLGYTINFGNPWSWSLLFGLLLVIGSVFVLL